MNNPDGHSFNLTIFSQFKYRDSEIKGESTGQNMTLNQEWDAG